MTSAEYGHPPHQFRVHLQDPNISARQSSCSNLVGGTFATQFATQIAAQGFRSLCKIYLNQCDSGLVSIEMSEFVSATERG